ncbi:MAG: DUF3052 family protein [Chloroflexi bacterium]|nr:DUF3052 family protein [Chloroflexota bacterium]
MRIQPGQVVCLLNASHEAAALLRQECPEGVGLSEGLAEGPCNAIIFWPTGLEGLSDVFAQLQRRIVPDGAIWVVMPKKRFARARDTGFTWSEMQAAALRTDLVDNKDVTLSKEEYATRFVIRKERRARYV